MPGRSRALVLTPNVLLLDEPFGALGASTIATIISVTSFMAATRIEHMLRERWA